MRAPSSLRYDHSPTMRPRDRRAVSEVIANILVLSLTVTMFGGIFYFVANLPGPGNDNVRYEIDATLESNLEFTLGSTVWINLTHGGGPVLYAHSTSTTLTLDGLSDRFSMRQGNLAQVWSLGATWSLSSANNASTILPGIVTPSSVLFVDVVDTERSLVIWSGRVFQKLNTFGPHIDAGVDPSPVLPGAPFTIWARVIEVEGEGIVAARVVSASFTLPADPNMTFSFPRDRWELQTATALTPGRYSFTVEAQDSRGLPSNRTAFFLVGAVPTGGPDVEVNPIYITLNPQNPQRGQQVTIESVVFNLGGDPSGANVAFYLNSVSNATFLGTRNLTTIAPGSGIAAKIPWTAAPGGLHTLIVIASTRPDPLTDTNPSNNVGAAEIAVLPKILVVDDDQQADGSPGSESDKIRAALFATGFAHDLYLTGPGNGPGYDSGATQMKQYDVVVWSTGRQTSLTMTQSDAGQSLLCGAANNGIDDVGQLTKFICAGGKVWLTGDGIINDASPGTWPTSRLAEFLDRYFAVTPAGVDFGTPAQLQSTGTPLWKTKVIDIAALAVPAPDGTDRIATTGAPAGAHAVLRDKAAPNSTFGVNWSGGAGIGAWRTVLTTVSLATLQNSGDQAQLGFHVMLWLSGLNKTLGRDVSVSSFSLSPSSPRYQQPVQLSVVVRNNGGQDEVGVELLFTESTLSSEKQIVIVAVPLVPAFGGTVQVNASWVPTKIGFNILRAIVDWNDQIEEGNEANNEISSLLFDGEVLVGYNLLVVDDDGLNGALPGNSTKAILDDLAKLNVGRALPLIEYDYLVVPSGQNGPTSFQMSVYNGVIWSTGSSTADVLTAPDRENLTRYLEQSPFGAHLWLVSPRLWEDVPNRPGNLAFACTKLGADFATEEGTATPADLYGRFDDPIAHGTFLSATAHPWSPRRVSACGAAAAGVLHGEPSGTDDYWNTSAAMKFYSTRVHNAGYRQKGVFLGLDPAYLSNSSASHFPRDEFTYMALHWLGVPDSLPNARVTVPDLFIGTTYGSPMDLSNLEVSRKVVLKAKVRNTGSPVLNGLSLRFLDGTTTVATDNTDIDGSTIASDWTVTDGVTVVEALWSPLFAGQRAVTVLSDPLASLAERTRVDNNASQSTRVWFFYDDMESGGGRWGHEAVITRINGENPIDIIPYGAEARTDIPGQWDTARSSGYTLDANVSHSSPNSFRMQEVLAPAVDVFLFFQNTNPLGVNSFDGVRTKFQVAQDAGKLFVGLMRPGDRVGLISVRVVSGSETDPHIDLTLIQASAGGKTTLNATIGAIPFQGGGAKQPQVDSTWVANCNLLVNLLGNPANTWASNRSKAIILVTGSSSQGDDDDPGPGCLGPGGTAIDPNTGACCGASGATTNWNGVAVNSGVAQIPIPVFVVNVHNGQAIEMKKVAESSCGGSYVDDPSGVNLEAIYRSLALLLTGGNQNFRSDPGFELNAPVCSPALRHRWLVTPPVKLDSSSSTASLSLWQRYSLISGQNGVVMQVGLPLSAPGANDAPGTFNCPSWHVGPCGDGAAYSREDDGIHWEYISPPKGRYNGNININATVEWPGGVRDDDNATMLYAWTGVSTKGTFGWERSEFDLTRYIGLSVRLNLTYYQFSGGSGKGWWVDDVVLKTERRESASVTDQRDLWALRCGIIAGRDTCAWANQDFDSSYGGSGFGYWHGARGLDNSLYSDPIDLTRAAYARLSFDGLYNVNPQAGLPPDSVRVEISSDAGLEWKALNLGVRIDPGVSGGGASPAWVSADTLSRFEPNISAWVGSVIRLRFRVITTTESGFAHCSAPAGCALPSTAGAGGFWVDNIRLFGASTSERLAPPEDRRGTAMVTPQAGDPSRDPEIRGVAVDAGLQTDGSTRNGGRAVIGPGSAPAPAPVALAVAGGLAATAGVFAARGRYKKTGWV